MGESGLSWRVASLYLRQEPALVRVVCSEALWGSVER